MLVHALEEPAFEWPPCTMIPVLESEVEEVAAVVLKYSNYSSVGPKNPLQVFGTDQSEMVVDEGPGYSGLKRRRH